MAECVREKPASCVDEYLRSTGAVDLSVTNGVIYESTNRDADSGYSCSEDAEAGS